MSFTFIEKVSDVREKQGPLPTPFLLFACLSGGNSAAGQSNTEQYRAIQNNKDIIRSGPPARRKG